MILRKKFQNSEFSFLWEVSENIPEMFRPVAPYSSVETDFFRKFSLVSPFQIKDSLKPLNLKDIFTVQLSSPSIRSWKAANSNQGKSPCKGEEKKRDILLNRCHRLPSSLPAKNPSDQRASAPKLELFSMLFLPISKAYVTWLRRLCQSPVTRLHREDEAAHLLTASLRLFFVSFFHLYISLGLGRMRWGSLICGPAMCADVFSPAWVRGSGLTSAGDPRGSARSPARRALPFGCNGQTKP